MSTTASIYIKNSISAGPAFQGPQVATSIAASTGCCDLVRLSKVLFPGGRQAVSQKLWRAASTGTLPTIFCRLGRLGSQPASGQRACCQPSRRAVDLG